MLCCLEICYCVGNAAELSPRNAAYVFGKMIICRRNSQLLFTHSILFIWGVCIKCLSALGVSLARAAITGQQKVHHFGPVSSHGSPPQPAFPSARFPPPSVRGAERSWTVPAALFWCRAFHTRFEEICARFSILPNNVISCEYPVWYILVFDCFDFQTSGLYNETGIRFVWFVLYWFSREFLGCRLHLS